MLAHIANVFYSAAHHMPVDCRQDSDALDLIAVLESQGFLYNISDDLSTIKVDNMEAGFICEEFNYALAQVLENTCVYKHH